MWRPRSILSFFGLLPVSSHKSSVPYHVGSIGSVLVDDDCLLGHRSFGVRTVFHWSTHRVRRHSVPRHRGRIIGEHNRRHKYPLLHHTRRFCKIRLPHYPSPSTCSYKVKFASVTFFTLSVTESEKKMPHDAHSAATVKISGDVYLHQPTGRHYLHSVHLSRLGSEGMKS